MKSDEIEPSEEKRRLRERMRELRARVTDGERKRASAAMTKRVSSLPELSRAKKVSCFVGNSEEIATGALIRWLSRERGGFFAPRVIENDQLELAWAPNHPEGFIAGAFGILEPDPRMLKQTIDARELDVIFIPGLAFDRTGARVGYGGGFYDRLLADCEGVFKVGLGFGFQLVESLPRFKHDVGLDAIVTDREVIRVDPL